MDKVPAFSEVWMCKSSRHTDAFCYFDLRDIDASEVPCVCCCIRMLFIYLDLRGSQHPLLSPLRLPVPPSRLICNRLISSLVDRLPFVIRCDFFAGCGCSVVILRFQRTLVFLAAT